MSDSIVRIPKITVSGRAVTSDSHRRCSGSLTGLYGALNNTCVRSLIHSNKSGASALESGASLICSVLSRAPEAVVLDNRVEAANAMASVDVRTGAPPGATVV